MSQETVEKVLGRLLTDDGFRRRAVRDLLQACLAEGYLLSPSELNLIRKMELERFAVVSENLDDSLKRFSLGPEWR